MFVYHITRPEDQISEDSSNRLFLFFLWSQQLRLLPTVYIYHQSEQELMQLTRLFWPNNPGLLPPHVWSFLHWYTTSLTMDCGWISDKILMYLGSYYYSSNVSKWPAGAFLLVYFFISMGGGVSHLIYILARLKTARCKQEICVHTP
jgi:hypothetical protein